MKNLKYEIEKEVREQTWFLPHDQIYEKVSRGVRCRLGNHLHDPLFCKVWEEVWKKIEDQVWYQIQRSSLGKT